VELSELITYAKEKYGTDLITPILLTSAAAATAILENIRTQEFVQTAHIQC
jgi:hypothetical protein